MFLKENRFHFTTEETRIRIRITLLTIFLKSVGQLWALEDYWTQMGVATGLSASIAAFNWSPARISVSIFRFSLGLYCKGGVSSFGQLVGSKTVAWPSFCFGWAENGCCALVLSIYFVSGSSSSLFRAFAETLGCNFRARESVFVGD